MTNGTKIWKTFNTLLSVALISIIISTAIIVGIGNWLLCVVMFICAVFGIISYWLSDKFAIVFTALNLNALHLFYCLYLIKKAFAYSGFFGNAVILVIPALMILNSIMHLVGMLRKNDDKAERINRQ